MFRVSRAGGLCLFGIRVGLHVLDILEGGLHLLLHLLVLLLRAQQVV